MKPWIRLLWRRCVVATPAFTQSRAVSLTLVTQRVEAGEQSINREFFSTAAQRSGEIALTNWRCCLEAGDSMAHFALDYTLYGRYHEAYRHLRYYAQIAPASAWNWCWLGRAAEAIGEVAKRGLPTSAPVRLRSPMVRTLKRPMRRSCWWGWMGRGEVGLVGVSGWRSRSPWRRLARKEPPQIRRVLPALPQGRRSSRPKAPLHGIVCVQGSTPMTTDPEIHIERLVKSPERVRDLGEVFTPRQIVDDMLDLLPKTMWNVDPSPTFLEPACGDGNFLVAILERKLDAVMASLSTGKTLAGAGDDALAFHCLQALASIYGVDISKDNIIGGVPEHPIGARTRMETLLIEQLGQETGKALRNDSKLIQSALWILEHNIQVANMLATHADGSPSYRDDLPLIVYEWDAAALRVTISKTTLGDVSANAQQESATAPSLFGGNEPELIWSGPYNEIHKIGVDSKGLRAAA